MARRVAVEKFLEDYEGWIVCLAVRHCQDERDLEDFVQELKLKVCEAGRSLDTSRAPTGYLYRAVYNRARDLAKAARRRASSVPLECAIIIRGEGIDSYSTELLFSDAVSRADWRSCLDCREYAVALVLSEGVVASEIVRSGCLTRRQVQYVMGKLRKKLIEVSV